MEVCILSYTHFTLDERKCLQKLLSEGLSMRKIAAILERSPSSVSREINRNKAKYKPHRKPDNPYWYNFWRAQNLYIRRRREQERRVLKPNTASGITLLINSICFGLQKQFVVVGISSIPRENHYVIQQFIAILSRNNSQKSQQKRTCVAEAKGLCQRILTTILYIRIGSYHNGQMQ